MAGLGLLFDTYVQNTFVVLTPLIAKQFHFTPASIGFLTSLFLIGYAIGSFLSGFAADYFGRKNALTFSVAGYTVIGALTALSNGFATFALFRGLTGLAASTEAPVGAISVIEASPDDRRGFSAGAWAAFYSAGYLLALAVTALVVHRLGWRWPFAMVIVVGLLVFWIRKRLSETPKYSAVLSILKHHRREKTPLHQLFTKSYLRRWISFCILWIGNGFTFYAFLTFMPLYLTTVRHYPFSQVLLILAVAQLFYAGIPWLIGHWSDRVGRRPAGIVSAILAIAGTWVMVSLPNGIPFLIALWITYGLYDGTWVIGWAFAPESFPTEIRGTALGSTLLVGRLVSFIGPIVVGLLSSHMSIGSAYKIISLTWLIAILGLLIAREVGSGSTVEELIASSPDQIAAASSAGD
ncbi:MAG: MFS transporter [Sulfobacillus sp.]